MCFCQSDPPCVPGTPWYPGYPRMFKMAIFERYIKVKVAPLTYTLSYINETWHVQSYGRILGPQYAIWALRAHMALLRQSIFKKWSKSAKFVKKICPGTPKGSKMGPKATKNLPREAPDGPEGHNNEVMMPKFAPRCPKGSKFATT